MPPTCPCRNSCHCFTAGVRTVFWTFVQYTVRRQTYSAGHSVCAVVFSDPTEHIMTAAVTTVTPVEDALTIDSADAIDWAQTCEILVVGWGAAGASTAIEARDRGADVLVIDRFAGGGASALSGGIVYAGGGTPYQQKAGFEDSVDDMYSYLKKEAQDVVKDETLRRFCENSVENLQWLEAQGVQFSHDMPKHKTSYPANTEYLYYSGNEMVPAYRVSDKKPAPRGHRAKGDGLSGPVFYAALQQSCLKKGVRTLTQATVRRLVQDKAGHVMGVEVWKIPENTPAAHKHDKLNGTVERWRNWGQPIAQKAREKAARLEREHAKPLYIRATRGVVLSTGGFIFNKEMTARHAPHYENVMQLGASGCDGSGMRLGATVGAATDHMEVMSAWRFITPPFSWPKGIVVNQQGERFCNEQVYGATLGYEMMENAGGKAWLILDKKLRMQCTKEALFGGLWNFQYVPALAAMWGMQKSSGSVEGLAKKINVPADALRRSIDNYNETSHAAIQQQLDYRAEPLDALGKSADQCQPLEGGYVALDISDTALSLPLPCITLGGLKINEETGAVLRADGSEISGLYAAGRAAVGIPSRRYMSGTSLADCVFSGRRAAAALAAVAAEA